MPVDLNDVASRMDEFRSLKDGWFEGRGLAPSHAGLDWFTSTFENNYPNELPLPFAFPTAEEQSKPNGLWAVTSFRWKWI